MTNERAGAWALIATSAAFVLILAVHPTHQGPPLHFGLTLNEMVHAAAIVAAPLWAYGGLAFHGHAGRDRPAATLALVFWLLGAVAVMAAATISGFVTPRAIALAGGDGGGAALPTLELSVWLNRGFAQVYAAATAIAILLWSLSWPAGRGAPALRLWGAAVGFGLLGWQLSGALAFEVDQAFVGTLALAGWIVPAAILVLRGQRGGGAAD